MTTIYQVRSRAISRMPYLAYAMLSAEPVATDHELPAPFCADRNWHFYYNPDAMDALETDDACASFMLETVRLLQRHADRLQRLIPDATSGQQAAQTLCALASEAVAAEVLNEELPECDYQQNLTTLQSLPIPQYYSRYFLPTAERVARRLLTLLPPAMKTPPFGQGNNSQNGQPQAGATPPPQGASSATDGEQPPSSKNEPRHQPSDGQPSKVKGVPKPIFGMGGSATDGIPRTWERPEISNTDRDTSERQRGIERQTAQQIQQAVGAGSEVTDVMVRWSEEVMGAANQRRLASLSSILRSATSYTRGYQLRRYDGRSRRQSALARYNQQRIIRPRWREIRPHIMFILDVSGSMGKDEIRSGLRYIASVLESIDMTEYCTLWLGNTKPQLACPRIDSVSVRKMDICCNGGTHMPSVCQKALEQARAMNLAEPDVIVCVTDGGTSWNSYGSTEPYRTRQPFVVALTDVEEHTEQSIFNKIRHYPIPEHMHVTTAGDYNPF